MGTEHSSDVKIGAKTAHPAQWILASSSPRRRELLERIGVNFRVLTAHTEEISSFTHPAEVVQDLAMQKAKAVQTLEPNGFIIASDTVVALGGEILGKPVDALENRAMLEQLSGRVHTVYTGIALLTPTQHKVDFDATQVQFRKLSSLEMDWYASSGEGLDKAGGYGIQEKGMLLISRIEGDFFNVMGLPTVRLLELARALDLELVPGL